MLRHRFLSLSLVLLGIVTALPASAEKRVALVIGIDTYDNLPNLKKARSDAAAMARTLADLNFLVIAKDDVTRSSFNTAWSEFLAKLEPGDTAAFFFAGHGVEVSGRNFLLPRDVPSIKPTMADLVKRESFSLQDLLDELREKNTRFNLVIIDACRDNPFPKAGSRSVGRARGLAVTEPPEGTFIIYSAGTGESALDRLGDDDPDPNSIFTRQLLPLLKTRGVSLTDVADELRLGVRKMASTVGEIQTPAYYNQVLGRMCLAGCSEFRPVPKFRIVSPTAGTTASGGRTKIKISVEQTPDPVKAIRVQVNGRMIDELEAALGSAGQVDGVQEFDVPLAKGRNDVRVTLVNAIGDKSASVSVNHEGQGQLDARGTLYIISVGAGVFPKAGADIPLLPLVGRDAMRMAQLVEERLAPHHAKVVKRVLASGDVAKDEPTASNIVDALDTLRAAGPNDTSIVFFAGHGFNDGPTYRFLGSDAEPLGGGLRFRAQTTLTGQQLQDAVESTKGRRILFIDTCHAGNAINVRLGSSVVAYAAASWNQGSFELPTENIGVFTHAVMEGLAGKAIDGAGKDITTKSLALYINRRVSEAAKDIPGMIQEPQYISGGDADEEYVLVSALR